MFAHNQTAGENFHVLDDSDMMAYGNGHMQEEWEKQKLAKLLSMRAFDIFE
jgi:hypothetical protein